MKPVRLALLLAASLAAPAAAQSGDRCEGSGSVFADDGSYEGGFGCTSVADCRMVHRLTPAVSPALLSKVCICFRSEGDPNLNFEIVAYDNDGPGGEPETLLGSKPGVVTGVPSTGRYVGVACSDLNILANGPIYVGAKWNSLTDADLFVCADKSAGTPVNPGYFSPNGGQSWASLPLAASDYRALGVRAEFAAEGADCTPSDTDLCLDNGRFRVSVTWTNFQGVTGVGHAQALTDTSGTFWFFTPDNIEFLVKTVDGCGFNERYWVFAAATTNVQYTMTVTDTAHDVTKVYNNPLGVAAPAITDSDAFATCP